MRILSRLALFDLVTREPKEHSVVVIHEVDKYEEVDDIVRNCKQALVLEMNDITSGCSGSPTKEQVQRAINSGYDIVACKQGISRSSAIAFLIESHRTTPQEAVLLWDVKKHFPNVLIMKYGMEILGDHIKPHVAAFYKKLAIYHGWKWQPHNLVTKYFSEDF